VQISSIADARSPPKVFKVCRYFSFGIVAIANGNAEDERNIFHTLQLGSLVFQVVRRGPPPTNYGTLERTAIPRQLELEPGLAVLIFPPTVSATWPGAGTLNWPGVMDFAHRGQDVMDGWVIPFDENWQPSEKKYPHLTRRSKNSLKNPTNGSGYSFRRIPGQSGCCRKSPDQLRNAGDGGGLGKTGWTE
jgi:hypothetical protein